MGMKLDQVIAVCVFILGAFYFWLALNVKPPIMRQSVGPEVFPIGIALCLTACSVWLFIQSTLSDDPRPVLEPRNPDVRSVGAMFAGLLGYGLLLDRLGYFTTTVAFLILTIAALETGRNHWPRTIVVALASSFSVYWIFDEWLGITLPSGFLL